MKENPNKVEFVFVGDVFPANLPYNRNCGVASLDFSDVSQKRYVNRIRKVIGHSDFLLGNLEAPILNVDNFSKSMQFAGHPFFIRMLKLSGFSMLSLANNHMNEHSDIGIDSTVEALENNDLDYIGLRSCSHERVIGGFKVVFLSYNAVDNNTDRICHYSEDRVCESILRYKESGYKHIFVILHWGDEFIHRPSPRQIKAAHSFIDCGAEFVIGSHSHVVQPVERYKEGLICYSLGNFIFDMTIPKQTRVGMILRLTMFENTFDYRIEYVYIDKDFFPSRIEKTKSFEDLMQKQALLMSSFDVDSYSTRYNLEKRRRRLHKRISEKRLLIKNWFKYTKEIRREFISNFYNRLFGHGKA